MVFCTECGCELSPGTKFCESCGAPAEPSPGGAIPTIPEPNPGPQQIPVIPPPPKPSILVPVLIIGCIILVAVIAAGLWFVGLPYLEKNGIPVISTPAQTPVPTPVPGIPVQQEILPVQTLSLTVTTTSPVRKLEGRYEEYYDEIYTLNHFFAFGATESFSHNLTTPPLYVKYNLTPKLLTREKRIDIGRASEETILITYPNPNAWFEIKVLDSSNGAVIEKHGYGKDYPDVTKSEFMVRSPGNYRIEFSGNDVTADISILQGIT